METKDGIEYIEEWLCPRPPLGVSYQVLEDRWVENNDGTVFVRLIMKIKIKEAGE